MKKIVFSLLVVLAVAFSACQGNKAAGLFETAQFEELQNNKDHAAQLYRQIIEKYPASEEAKKAETRLAELQAGK